MLLPDGRKLVKMLAHYQGYQPNDLAGFEVNEADTLCAQGRAEDYQEEQEDATTERDVHGEVEPQVSDVE